MTTTTEDLIAKTRLQAKWWRSADHAEGKCSYTNSDLFDMLADALEALSSRPVLDDPELDATDAAHPAWWRGHDHTSQVFCQLVTDILDGKDTGWGFNYEPWHTLRRRLLTPRTFTEGSEQRSAVEIVRAFNKWSPSSASAAEEEPAPPVSDNIWNHLNGNPPPASEKAGEAEEMASGPIEPAGKGEPVPPIPHPSIAVADRAIERAMKAEAELARLRDPHPSTDADFGTIRTHIDTCDDMQADSGALIRALSRLQARFGQLEGELADERMEHGLLKELLSRPQIDEFWEGIVTEAAHQRQRWGDAHDRDKSAENWFWLVGYLAGKALRAAIAGDEAKARHHTISASAALFQWWKAIPASPNGIGVDADLDPDLTRNALAEDGK